MKKVQCPSCGGTGVMRGRSRSTWVVNKTYQCCYKCKGFGFILKDNIKLSHKGSKVCLIAFGELQEFFGLVKVRNVSNVFVPGLGLVPYSVFYEEHRNHK